MENQKNIVDICQTDGKPVENEVVKGKRTQFTDGGKGDHVTLQSQVPKHQPRTRTTSANINQPKKF